MSSALNNFSTIQHYDFIAIADCAETMGDNQAGAATTA
jgi:hypothetical protein